MGKEEDQGGRPVEDPPVDVARVGVVQHPPL